MKDLRFAHILLVEDSDADADFFQDFFERQRIGNKVTRVIYKDAAGYTRSASVISSSWARRSRNRCCRGSLMLW
jgi:hypothetical protein